MVALGEFNAMWLVGLATFGVHLVLLGWLVVRSRWVTKILGYVLVAAGVAYILDTVAHGLLANYQDHAGVFQVVVALPSVIGELSLGLWLLAKAGRTAPLRA